MFKLHAEVVFLGSDVLLSHEIGYLSGKVSSDLKKLYELLAERFPKGAQEKIFAEIKFLGEVIEIGPYEDLNQEDFIREVKYDLFLEILIPLTIQLHGATGLMLILGALS